MKYLIFCIFLIGVIGFSKSSRSPLDDPHLFLGKYPIPKKTPSPLNINPAKVKNEASNLSQLHCVEYDKYRNVTLINTGKAIEGIVDPSTTQKLTGGVLFDDLYKLYKVVFYWSDNPNQPAATTIDGKNGTAIETWTFWYRESYGSFDNALNYRYGLVGTSSRISVQGSTRNENFTTFHEALQKITEPGSSSIIQYEDIISWTEGSGLDKHYYSYPGQYTDLKTGKIYYCVVYCLHRPIESFISLKQYNESFGKLKNLAGAALINTAQTYPQKNTPVILGIGE